jgi:hypothetical protein
MLGGGIGLVVVDTQPAFRMTWQVANCCMPVHAIVQKASTQLPWMAKNNLGFGPPTPQNGPCDHAIEVTVCDNPADIQRQ